MCDACGHGEWAWSSDDVSFSCVLCDPCFEDQVSRRVGRDPHDQVDELEPL
jgi:hypothetical protein